MKKELNNYAYIDGANLHNGVADFGWKLDYARFRVWLSEKYSVKSAYIFLGLIPKYKELYTYLQKCGFTLIFKRTDAPITYLHDVRLFLQKEKAPDADGTAQGSFS